MTAPTVITAAPRRSIGYGTFDDLADGVHVESIRSLPGGLLEVTFADTLTDEQTTAAWERMTSRDDADQAARATLRGADGAANLAEMVRAYVLGDPMLDPIYP